MNTNRLSLGCTCPRGVSHFQLLLLAASAVATAQEVSPASASSAAQADESQLQEVVVTAQFRKQDLQATPLAISAVTSSAIEAQGARDIADVTNRIPSVTFT